MPASTEYLDSQPDLGPDGHQYNDDLLLDENQRNAAKAEFGSCFHVLDNPELRDAFQKIDKEANLAKKRSSTAGAWAVFLAWLSFLISCVITFGESYFHFPLYLSEIGSFISALFGVMSVLIGGVLILYGKRKNTWLNNRLFTERLRQFHFQSFIWDFDEIIDSINNPDKIGRYKDKRNNNLKDLLQEYNPERNKLIEILNPELPNQLWLHRGNPYSEIRIENDKSALCLFTAYIKLRFDQQVDYAKYVTRRRNSTNKRFKTREIINLLLKGIWYPFIDRPLLEKKIWLSRIFTCFFGLLMIIHLSLILSFFVKDIFSIDESLIHCITMVFAFSAIAAKTLMEGLAIRRELERMEEYKLVTSRLRTDFVNSNSVSEKLRIMMEMERAAFEEMRIFLRTHNESSFLM